jgi:ABC-2 type transport system ATP-binding protein
MLEVSGLRKSYEGTPVLKGLSFDIKQGEFFGLLGPNGAGKTTTISIMSAILQADEGTVRIAGSDIRQQALACKKIIGVVPQEIALYNDLSAIDNLMFWGGLYKVADKELKSRADETLKLFGLYERRNDKIKNYSGGMKRRINIASALLHKPQVLFMDEPTVGIDPQSRNLIYEVVEKLHSEGMTIVYTTHYMEEAERFCDRIVIMDSGAIIAEGTLDELRSSSKIKETVLVTFEKLEDSLFEKLSLAWPDLQREGNEIRFFSASVKNDLSKIVLKCSEAGLDILNIEIQKLNLETIFLNLTGKQLRD